MQYKILIVDDDTELLKMLRSYFEIKQYTVITAENGAEALEKVSLVPDLILLDINMPHIDGIEVCRRIRDQISCPIIFLTAKVEEQDRVNGLLGENGAGKTTLMRVLTTVLKPAGGNVTIDGMLYSEGNYEKIQKRIGYLPQEIDLYPHLTVRECLEYMGELSGVEKAECKKRIDKYLEKTSLAEHQKKKMRQLSGGMKRRVGLVQALLNEPDFLIVDEPTTGLDPEERIRIRNLLVDFAEDRTVLFSTHVVEDLAATCNQLAVMKKGEFLFAGNVRDLLIAAKGHVWSCHVEEDWMARKLEEKYHISAKQYTDRGMQLRLISERRPGIECEPCEATLEDAYIYVTNGF